MSRVEVFFLGSGSAIPTPLRWHPSVLVRDWIGNHILLDAGEGVQLKMRSLGLSPSKINSIIITHPHGDHINGLAGLLMTMSLQGRRKPLTIVSTSEAVEFILETLEATKQNLGFEVKTITAEGYGKLDLSRGSGDRLTVRWLPSCHTVDSISVRLDWILRPRIAWDRLEALGLRPGAWIRELVAKGSYRVSGRIITLEEVSASGWKTFSIGYTGDTTPCDRVVEGLVGVNLLIHDSTLHSRLREEALARGHSTSLDAALVARKVGADLLVLFHISSRYQGFEARKLLLEAREAFPRAIIAWDGMRLLSDAFNMGRETRGGAAGI